MSVEDIPWYLNINILQRHHKEDYMMTDDGAVVMVRGIMYELRRRGWVKLSQDGSVVKEMSKEEGKLLDRIKEMEDELE